MSKYRLIMSSKRLVMSSKRLCYIKTIQKLYRITHLGLKNGILFHGMDNQLCYNVDINNGQISAYPNVKKQKYVRFYQLKFIMPCSIISIRNFERVFAIVSQWEVIHMDNEDLKNEIIELINQTSDAAILRRIYLILVAIVGTDR